jgi:ribosome biogenesis GTPase A
LKKDKSEGNHEAKRRREAKNAKTPPAQLPDCPTAGNNPTAFIHWYPGHIAKAERKLKEQLSLVDAVIEVLDARLPRSSGYENISGLLNGKPRLILLNKSDLVDAAELKQWISLVEQREGFPVLKSDAKNSKDLSFIVKKVLELAEPRIQAAMAKGLLRRPARIMVVGMPNVGKSSIINKLTRSSKTKIGAKAGVTRRQQWVRINPQLELLDTPGIIPMKQEDQTRAKKLAFVNSVSENAYSNGDVAAELLEVLPVKYLNKIREYYNVDNLTVENIAMSRNWIISGGEPDMERTSVYILRDFREGKIGKFILDELN